MDVQNLGCSNGNSASCLESFRKSSSRELPRILKHYNKNISGKKADLLVRYFINFCRFQSKLKSQKLLLDSYMDHTTCSTYKAAFSLRIQSECEKMLTRKTPNTNTFHAVKQLTIQMGPFQEDLCGLTTIELAGLVAVSGIKKYIHT